MHLVYLGALHNPCPHCLWFEKHGSSLLDVPVSATVIERYVTGPGDPRNIGEGNM